MKRLLVCTSLLLASLSCQSSGPAEVADDDVGASSLPGEDATRELNDFFEEVYQARLARSPERQSYLGIKDDQGRWDDLSPEHALESHELVRDDLQRMRSTFDGSQVDDSASLSYRLFEFESEERLADHEWRLHNYPVNQMHGRHTGVVSLLCNVHRVDTIEDAQAYIERLHGVRPLLDQLRANMLERQAAGILPPAFVFPRVLEDCRNIIAGAPFEAGAPDSVLAADFRAKVEALEGLSEAQRTGLLSDADEALLRDVGPAYEQLIELLEAQQAVATTEDGAWKLPDGARFYARQLRRHTSTDLTADEIHELGLANVTRIHGEMEAIMDAVGFEGDREAFFEFMRTDDRFYYANTEEGRAEYLARAEEIIRTMEARLDEWFETRPKSELIVKAVEPYRAASAGKAFYSRGAPDGSRPGIYYANLHSTRDMPTYQMEALAYHEAIPGHHMQGSLAMELEGLPRFRRNGHHTAYGEGWGLYSEMLPKELGFYDDPYSDFGRLAMELWRACRLVVDTGIHHHRWTREQAIEYLLSNTPNPEGDSVKAIERYIVMPGQATAYTVGMLEILRLRAEAKRELGDAFDLRGFHEVVLGNGPVPLSILAELVEEWVTNA